MNPPGRARRWRSRAIALAAAVVAPISAAQLVDRATGTMASVRDCDVRYRVHGSADPRQGPVALIAHGFLRSGEYMAGWADAFARAGTTAVAVDLCASSLPGGRHADNGADLVALRKALKIEEVIYVGVSAGGLAALFASSQDPATKGLLLLDPTNAGGQARSAASRVRAPVAALIAKPQICNAWRNIDPALETLRDVTIVRVDSASHCDFEWPTDRFCRIACLSSGSDDGHRLAEAQIRRIGLGFVGAIATGGGAALPHWKAEIGETR